MQDPSGPISFEITELTSADVDDVWAFFERLPDGDRTFVKQPVTDLDTVRRWLDDERSVRAVARLGSRIVGYVALSPGTGWSRHVGELRLVVDPEIRRRGLGQRLARHGLRIALDAGLTKVVVEVVAEQESTIALFTGLGFRAEALLVDHVQDPEGRYGDLIVLANRTDDDWRLLTTVGLDQPLE
jgi:ribosomal protein S18 acetylase RimI-like enzyme